MAVFNEPTKWQTSLVNSGDANTIPQNTPAGTGEASFEEGFPQITQVPIGAGGQAPDRKDFNGLFKVLGDWIFFAQNGGVPTYSADFDYVAGRVVLYDNNLYKCIQANGASSTVVAPDSVSPAGSDYWVQVATLADFANFANTDLSNVTAPTQTFKNMVIDWLLPDYTAPISISTLPYTAPSDGYFFFTCGDIREMSEGTIAINGTNVFYWYDGATDANGQTGNLFVKKDDVLTSNSNSLLNKIFYPCKGAN